MEEAERRIAKARIQLFLTHPWYGHLAMRLKVKQDDSTGTMSTNGTMLYYNEQYVQERSESELVALMAHEVGHCALLHCYRGQGRNWGEWNEAADLVINPVLRDEGFILPPHPLESEEARFRGMSAEQIYAIRARERGEDEQEGSESSSEGAQQGNSKGTGIGNWPDFQPAPADADVPGEEPMTATDWQVAAEQATAIANKAGKGSAGMDRAIKANKQATTDWRTILRRFIEQTIPSDYSWTSPNRRYIAQGLYLPGMVKENTPRIGVAVDTSGSIGGALLEQFSAEITAILHEVRPERIDVVYCDWVVNGKESFTPDDPEIKLSAKGGGGTAFQPALDVFNEDPPACVVYLTDLEGPAPEEPLYPVLWAVPEGSWVKEPPFSEMVTLSKYS